MAVCCCNRSKQFPDSLQSLRILGFAAASVGAIFLLGVLRRRQIPWLVVDTDEGERSFPLENEITPEVERFIQDPKSYDPSGQTIAFRQI